MKRLVVGLINLYQKTLSPDHGAFKALYPHGFCKFYPSCSEYAKQAVEKHGVGLGLIYALKRLVFCNPWSKGGVDLVK